MSQASGAVAAQYPDIGSGPMLDISNLNVYYGESHILRNVDMGVAAGKMVCLIGRNGVGKTTLLKSIMGLLNPRSGAIQFRGEDITRKPTYQRAKMGIGYVPQGREVIPRLTIKENLLLGMEALPQGSGKNQEIPEEIFELFPVLKTMLSRMGGDLSGGQQQILALGQAFVARPRVLLSDEPSLGLAQALLPPILQFLRRWAASGTAIVIVEQHIDIALGVADRALVIERGAIKLGCAAGELKSRLQQLAAAPEMA